MTSFYTTTTYHTPKWPLFHGGFAEISRFEIGTMVMELHTDLWVANLPWQTLSHECRMKQSKNWCFWSLCQWPYLVNDGWSCSCCYGFVFATAQLHCLGRRQSSWSFWRLVERKGSGNTWTAWCCTHVLRCQCGCWKKKFAQYYTH